tara:strand:- start:350211 stop:350936 length:726 start_codon:yes stop_codon:yes gene_type:complete
MDDFFSTLVGAVLAFYFGLGLYKRQKKQENISYLHHCIAALSQLNNHAYGFKKQVVMDRKNEAISVFLILNGHIPLTAPTKLSISNNSNYIFSGTFKHGLSIERLSFIAEHSPNILILIGSLINSVEKLNLMVDEINSEILSLMDRNEPLPLERVKFILQRGLLLSEQVDELISFNEKTLKVLISFGYKRYRKNMSISKSDIIEEYEEFRPAPLKGWGDDSGWISTKRPVWHKLYKWFMTQ